MTENSRGDIVGCEVVSSSAFRPSVTLNAFMNSYKVSSSGQEGGEDEEEEENMVECLSTLGGIPGNEEAAEEHDDGDRDMHGNGNSNVFLTQNNLSLLPPQLHPAAAMGMRRVSSCYLSIQSSDGGGSRNGSTADFLPMWDDADTGGRDKNGNFESAVDEDWFIPRRASYLDLDGLDEPFVGLNIERKQTGDCAGRNNDRGHPDMLAKPSSSVKTRTENAAQKKEMDSECTSIADRENSTPEKAGCGSAAVKWNAVHVLYHDIMMHVLTFLDARSLAGFSETARRPNFECFYFLQLQLQRALLYSLPSDHPVSTTEVKGTFISPPSHPRPYLDDSLSTISGVGSVSRLASIDTPAAQSIVREYVESNSTLRTMPLSHSLAYLRHVLRRHGFPAYPHVDVTAVGPPPHAVASAAVLVTLLGAASYMGGSSYPDYAAALRHALPRMALAGGLMKAGVTARETARKMAEEEKDSRSDDDGSNSGNERRRRGSGGGGGGGGMPSMREAAEQMARMFHEHFHLPHFPLQHMPHTSGGGDYVARDAAANDGGNESGTHCISHDQSLLSNFPSSIAARLYGAFCAAYGPTAPESSSDQTDALCERNGNGTAAPPSLSTSEGSSETSYPGRRNRGKRTRSKRNRISDPADDGSPPSQRTMGEGRKSADNRSGNRDVTTTKKEEKLSTSPDGPGLQQSSTSCSLDRVGADDRIVRFAMENPISPNPYDHLPSETITEVCSSSDDNNDGKMDVDSLLVHAKKKMLKSQLSTKMPSGCIGAYSRAVRRATDEVTRHIKQVRKANFEALSEEEREVLSTSFIDACTSDETLSVVKDILQKRNAIDADGFYVGSDGTETCGLHTAAFHGACRVLEFLCSGIDEFNPDNDGGMCNVNLIDGNGWTAMHFAAGANSVSAVRILATHGADLAVEAGNGYTPYHWAERLSNEEVVAELTKLGADNRFCMFGSGGAGGRRRPQFSSFFASRFFALIPTQ